MPPIPQNWKKVAAPRPRQVSWELVVRRPPCLLAAGPAAPQGLLIAPWQEVASSKLASTRADYPHPPSLQEGVAPVTILGRSPPLARVSGEHGLLSSAFSDALHQLCQGSPSLARESPLTPAHSPSTCPILPLVIGSFGCSRMGPSVLGQVKAWVWTLPRLPS